MGKVNIPYVHPVKTKGRLYHYYRRGGLRHGKLPGAPGSPEFMAEYDRIHAQFGDQEEDGPKAGSVGALVERYLRSTNFQTQIKEQTQQEYRYYCELIRKKMGYVQATSIRPGDIEDIRDNLRDTPGKANAVVKMFRILWAFGRRKSMVTTDPAGEVTNLKTRPHKAWPQALIDRWMAEANEEMVWAAMVGLYTGQRLGDCVKMRWSDYDGKFIQVVQIKGFDAESEDEETLWIPCHKNLKHMLDNVIPKRSTCILTTSTGRVWTTNNLKGAMRRQRKRLGVQEKYTFHGLRKNATKALAEAGCSTKQMMAVTGHKSTEMAEFYARQADQKKMAEAAIDMWEADKP